MGLKHIDLIKALNVKFAGEKFFVLFWRSKAFFKTKKQLIELVWNGGTNST